VREQEVFILADRALERVVDQIKNNQWERVVPDEMTPRQPGSTLREVVNYHAYDDAWVHDVLDGKTMREVGGKYDGDLLGDHPKLNFASIVESAVIAVRDFRDLEKTVHLSYGDFTARDYLRHITCFRGLRVYDIARFIGADASMPEDLVRGLWEQLKPAAESLRQMGVFGAAVEVPLDAPLRDRLLGLTGRRPG
jgi:uncharacterized protein (TIGR03086 family)